MTDIVRFQHDDRPGIEAVFRAAFGDVHGDALHMRWPWLYDANPYLTDGVPRIFVARDNGAIVGQFASIPVRLVVNGAEIDAGWGTDFAVLPNQRGKGVGFALMSAWDSEFGAAIALSPTDASVPIFIKIGCPYLGPVPRFAKPVSDRTRATWKSGHTSLKARLQVRVRQLTQRLTPISADIRKVSSLDEKVTQLWERVASRFAFAVRRDARYLNWRYINVPGVQYELAQFNQGNEAVGFVVFRYTEESERRIAVIVDFLADPAHPEVLVQLFRWVEREAVKTGADLLRAFATHHAFQGALRQAGFEDRPTTLRFIAKINAVHVPLDYYASTHAWHVTKGDSDSDR